MVVEKDDIEISNKEIMELFRRFIQYLKTENPKQRQHKLINKSINAFIVVLILAVSAYLGSIKVLEGQMVSGLYGAALGYLFGIGRN